MEAKAKLINELAKKYKKDTAKILSDMIKIPGFSGGEKNVCKCVVKYFKKYGVKVQIDSIGNVIAQVGKGPCVVVFDGHIDTVEVGQIKNWKRKPHSGDIDDTYVYGRGASDQRGGIAAFITASRILKKMKLGKELTCYFVASVMEEDCDGLCWKYIIDDINNGKKQKKWKMKKPDLVISTESTHQENGEIAIYRGHRGRMEIEVEFIGKSCHASAPERGVNAIYLAAEFCKHVEELHKNLKVDDFLGKGTVVATRIITGSPSLCAVSDRTQVHLDRRLTEGESEESAIGEIEKILYEIMKLKKGVEGGKTENKEGEKFEPTGRIFVPIYKTKAYTGKDVEMKKFFPTWSRKESSFEVQTGMNAYKMLFGREPKIDKWTFSTNCVTICGKHGIPCIGFGPGYEKEAHEPNEKCPVIDLMHCSAFYAMYAFCYALYKKDGVPKKEEKKEEKVEEKKEEKKEEKEEVKVEEKKEEEVKVEEKQEEKKEEKEEEKVEEKKE